jgi:hypothetical protein
MSSILRRAEWLILLPAKRCAWRIVAFGDPAVSRKMTAGGTE